MADPDGLLNRYTGETLYRGFESLPLRRLFPAREQLADAAASVARRRRPRTHRARHSAAALMAAASRGSECAAIVRDKHRVCVMCYVKAEAEARGACGFP